MESEKRRTQYCAIKTDEKTMKSFNFMDDLFQLTVIVTMSAIGIIAFSESHLGNMILQGLCVVLQRGIAFFPVLWPISDIINPLNLLLLLAFLLCINGIRSMIFGRKSGGRFSMLVTLLYLPSLLPYSVVCSQWLDSLFRGALSPFLVTQLSYGDALFFATSIVFGHISLSLTSTFRDSANDFYQRGSDEDDVKKISLKEHVYFFTVIGGAILTIITVIGTSMNISVPVIGRLIGEPWGIMFIGLFSSLMILTSAYYFIVKMTAEHVGPEIIKVVPGPEIVEKKNVYA